MPSYIIDNLGGGMNRTASDVLSDRSQWRLLMNWKSNKIGALSKVPGISQIGSNLANSPVEALYFYPFISANGTTQNHIIATCSSKPYYYNDITGSWLSATVYTPVVGERSSFTSVNNNLAVICKTRGLHRSTDGGITYASVSASPTGQYLTTYRNSVWIAGDTTAANVNRVWRSNIAQVSAWEGNYETAEDALVGINSQADQLLMFGATGRIARNNLQIQRTFTYDQLGINNANISNTDIFEAWRTDDDIKVYDGNTPLSIGKRVQDILDAGETTLASCFLRSYNAYMGDITIDDNSYQNVLATYDMDYDMFYLRDDLDIRSLSQVTILGKQYLAFGDSVGNVWKIDPAVTTNASGSSGAIASVAVSVPHYLTEPKRKKIITDIFVTSQYGEGTDFFIRTDFGQWTNLGQLNGQFTTFPNLSYTGHNVQIMLENKTTGTTPEVSYIEIKYDIDPTNYND